MINRDPLASLIAYVNEVKPYHTKVYEVILQYAHAEPIKSTVKEKYHISILMTDPEANSWLVNEGQGWDTGPFDMDQQQPLVDIDGKGARNWGRWDFDDSFRNTSPSRILTSVKDTLSMTIEDAHTDEAVTYVNMHPIGWDMAPWDIHGFDNDRPRMIVEQNGVEVESAGARVSESLYIIITDGDVNAV